MSPLFTELRQVCTVVDDLELTLTNLVEHLGIGPFRCWSLRVPHLFDTTLRGRPADWSMKIALAWLGDTQWEVIQPLEGATLYREHLDAHGAGVEHLLMNTGVLTLQAAADRLARAGHPLAQTAFVNTWRSLLGVTLPSNPATRALSVHFGYANTAATLRTNLELIQYPAGLSDRFCLRIARVDFCVPDSARQFEKPLPNLHVSRLVKVGIVTRDLDATVREWIDLTGVAPWHLFDLGPDRLEQVTFAEGPATFRVRVAWALVGETLIEVVQPTGGASPYQALIDTRGEAVGWLGVTPRSSFGEVVKRCEGLGYAKRLHGPLLGHDASAWFDARAWLGTDIEILNVDQDVSSLFNRIMPDRVVSA